MKRVLLIAHLFNKGKSIGSIRLQGLAKFLPEFDWEPVILTAAPPAKPAPQFNIIETPYENLQNILIKKLGLIDNKKTVREKLGLPIHKNKRTLIDFVLYLQKEIFAYPDPQKGWYNRAVKAGNKLLQKQSFDAIISSSMPATSHLIASNLRSKHEIPWIADFRDLWTQNHYFTHISIRRDMEHKLELKTLSKADALVTISLPLAEKLRTLHKKIIHVIPNGFDPVEINPFNAGLTKKFTVTYSGSFYQGKRDPSKFFKAVQDLISNRIVNRDDIEIRFYSPIEEWLRKEIKYCDLQDVVKCYGIVDREDVLKKQRESQVLLLLLWDNPEEKGVYTGKIFEYLSARRPILAIGGYEGVVKDLLDETNAGIFARSTKEIKNSLIDLYHGWKDKDEVPYQGEMSKINKYSHREMAKKFAEVLDSVTNHDKSFLKK